MSHEARPLFWIVAVGGVLLAVAGAVTIGRAALQGGGALPGLVVGAALLLAGGALVRVGWRAVGL